MPPITRFTAERILDVALELTRRSGIGAITARGVAAGLGCSTGPVFKQFSSMDDLHEQLIERISGFASSSVEMRKGISVGRCGSTSRPQPSAIAPIARIPAHTQSPRCQGRIGRNKA